MKKYRLKKWYPSLDKKIEVGDIGGRYLLEFGNGTKEDRFSVLKGSMLIYIPIRELHPDFWELIEEEKPKPLFVTDDGVELFDEADKLFIVNKKCYKKESKISNLYDKANRKDFKYFFYEANADEYIWRNKPVFSYEEIWKYAPYGSPLSIFEQLAKERAKE